jgi:hypothetical protein
MARQTHSPDLIPTAELDGFIDYSHFKSGTPRIEQSTEREFATLAETEAFMQEKIGIELHQTTDKNAPLGAEVGINGEMVWIPRGVKVLIPRKFVERLAQSQVRSYKQVDNPNRDADDGKLTRSATGTDYAFSVLHDPNPKGKQWLTRMTRQGS